MSVPRPPRSSSITGVLMGMALRAAVNSSANAWRFHCAGRIDRLPLLSGSETPPSGDGGEWVGWGAAAGDNILRSPDSKARIIAHPLARRLPEAPHHRPACAAPCARLTGRRAQVVVRCPEVPR